MRAVFGTLLGQKTPTWSSLHRRTILSNAGKKRKGEKERLQYEKKVLLTRFKKRDGTSGELKFELEGHAMGLLSVDTSADGTRKYRERRTHQKSKRYIKKFDTIVLVSTSVDSNIRIWDLENGTLMKSITANPVEAWKAVFSPDAQIVVTGSHNGDINFFNVKLGEKVNSLPTKNKFLLSVAYVSFFIIQ